jgi:hypothetical protein
MCINLLVGGGGEHRGNQGKGGGQRKTLRLYLTRLQERALTDLWDRSHVTLQL